VRALLPAYQATAGEDEIETGRRLRQTRATEVLVPDRELSKLARVLNRIRRTICGRIQNDMHVHHVDPQDTHADGYVLDDNHSH
jgi:hypothetical protein